MTTISTPPDQEDAAKRRRGVLKAITEHWLPFLTAILVLATAIVGLYAKRATSERNDLQESSASFEDDITELSNRNDDLAVDNERLQAENDDLRDQIENPETSTPPTTSELPPPSSPEVLRDSSGTPVVVGAYDGIDLDSQETNWGVESPSRDLYVQGGARSVNVTDMLAIVQSPPTPDVCEAQTIRQGSLDTSETVTGQQICVRSGEGRWAYVRIAAINAEAETISFDIVVWKLPSDP